MNKNCSFAANLRKLQPWGRFQWIAKLVQSDRNAEICQWRPIGFNSFALATQTTCSLLRLNACCKVQPATLRIMRRNLRCSFVVAVCGLTTSRPVRDVHEHVMLEAVVYVRLTDKNFYHLNYVLNSLNINFQSWSFCVSRSTASANAAACTLPILAHAVKDSLLLPFDGETFTKPLFETGFGPLSH